MNKNIFIIIAAVIALGLAVGEASAKRTIKVPKGSKVEVQGNVARISGQGASGTWECVCSKSTGSCTILQIPTGMSCNKGSGDTCKGDCVFMTSTTTEGKAAGKNAPVNVSPDLQSQ